MTIGILSLEEMKEITGASTKARMLEVLVENGIPHFIKANGWPVTTAEAVNGTLLKKDKYTAKAPVFHTSRPEETPGFRLPKTRLA